VAAMTEVLDTAWDDQQVLAEIDRMEALISAYIPAEEQDVFTTDLTALRATVDGREAEIRSQLGGLSSASANSLMEPLCFTKSGSVTGPFSTTWGAGGTADLLVDLDGSPLVYTAQTSIAVPDDNNPDEAIVAVFGDFADGSRSVLFVPMPITGVSPGTVNIDTGFLLFYPPGGGDQWDRFELVAGSITFSQASTVVGQPVTGTFALDIWQTPFF